MSSEDSKKEPAKAKEKSKNKKREPLSSSTDEASRYAALRNHSIRFEDAIDPNAQRIYDISKKDIVFGRGKGFQNHPGNQRMRKIIDKYKVQYHSLKRSEKRVLVETVYNEIIEGGARFLKKVEDENAWAIVDAPVALQKVSHTLRCRKNNTDALVDQKRPGGSAASGVVNRFSGGAFGTDGTVSGLMPSSAALHSSLQNPALNMGAMASMGVNPSLDMDAAASMGFGLPPGNFMSSMAGAGGMLPGAMGSMGAMGAMGAGFSPNIEYLNSLRREQLLRETMMLQQMGDVCMLGSNGMPRLGGNGIGSLNGLSMDARQQLMGGSLPNSMLWSVGGNEAPADRDGVDRGNDE